MKIKVETEQKYYYFNPKKLIEKIQNMGFTELPIKVENDEYFTDINSEFIKNRTCLRIRKTNNKDMEITFKGKSTSLLGQYCKLENNINADINEYDNFVSLFTSLGFYSYCKVEKERYTFFKNDKKNRYSIMIDTLPNIGGFIEFEIISEQEDSKKEELNIVLRKFVNSFSEFNLKEETKPYRDVVADYIFKKNKCREKIENIYKYSDKDGTKPKINKLNSSSWLKTRKYVEAKIKDITKELMDLYQKRLETKTTPYKRFEEEQIFGNEFIYDLTLDQQNAVNDINDDLDSDIPMDRLLCGDVGFGKTEVALRAMFRAILNNKQVIYLCPTTILSKQQFNVAKKRFASWPIEIRLYNRFTTLKEEQDILTGLENGSIDVVFGTHKLFNDKIKYKKLGLLIIDEEQRFGVKHKEKIKELKNDINVLTLSATPIPRTLKMALSGLRNLSIIETAPNNRYPVQTYVTSEDDYIIKDAIYKELGRNGQIFILYNNIEGLVSKMNSLKLLVPEAKIRCAHGQMNKDALDEIMEDFTMHKFDILLCTTIIENGIDIANANTLIVYDADKFGLAQLYQIRGRVGRSDKIAYAYLLYNKNKMLNETAIKRLHAIKEFTALGSGYKIAMRDLSIRGSGDIFGSSQAGFVDTVGVSLYTKMIEDELKRVKGLPVEESKNEQSLININTHIDDSYVDDENIKIEIHQMINEIDSYDKLQQIKNILEDRFGKITLEMEDYMYEEWFEKIAQKYNITQIRQTDRFIEIVLPEKLSSKVKGDKLLLNALSISRNFSFAFRHNQIIITLKYANLKEHFIRYIVRLLNTIN